MKKIVFYTFLLILAYLALVHYTGFAKDLTTGFSGYTGAVTALQGR
jgi:hypothetical protein